jgi:hypothetical protein
MEIGLSPGLYRAAGSSVGSPSPPSSCERPRDDRGLKRRNEKNAVLLYR